MKLRRTRRDWYVLTIATTPALSGTWEASFDNEETWVEGILDDGAWHWLVSGPDFVLPDGWVEPDDVVTLTEDTQPLVRIKDDPVVDVQSAPIIEVYP